MALAGAFFSDESLRVAARSANLVFLRFQRGFPRQVSTRPSSVARMVILPEGLR